MKRISLMVIVILMMHSMYSQDTDIKVTPQQQKRINELFVPKKIVEYSKGLSNEENLRKYVIQLELVIQEKDSLLQDLFDKLIYLQNLEEELLDKESVSLENILSLTSQLQEAQNEIKVLASKQKKVQKKESNFGVYLTTEYGTSLTSSTSVEHLSYKHAFFGLELVRSKMIYGLKVNPVNEKFMYAGSVSFKIF